MSMLKIGDRIPNFSVKDDENNMFSEQNIKDKIAIIYFYPKDDTPGCTQEAKDFSSFKKEFDNMEVDVIGVSKDGVNSHKKFKEKYELNFTLLSDENSEMVKNFGVLKEKSMFGKKYMGIERTTFLIDKHKNIVHIWPDVKVKDHVQNIIEKIKSII